MRPEVLYLTDIIEAADAIQRFVGTREREDRCAGTAPDSEPRGALPEGGGYLGDGAYYARG